METKVVVTNREEAIEVIKNDERYIKLVRGFSNGQTYKISTEDEGNSFCKIPKIIESIDYSDNEIKMLIKRKDWNYYYKVFKEMFRDIISDNDLEDYVDIYINKAECWIKVM